MRSRINRKHKQSTLLIRHGGSFTMPGRFKVTVTLLGKEEAKEEGMSTNLAQYWQDDHIIALRRSRSKRNRKADLEHELQHCCVDWIDFFMRKAKIVPNKKSHHRA